MGRANQFTATVSAPAAARDLGEWSALEGGGLDGDDSIHYPGSMRPGVSLGSQSTTENVTLRKLEADLTDDDIAWLIATQGTAEEIVAVKQRLNSRNQSARRPITYRGTLKTVNFAAFDSTSNDPGLIEIVLTVIGKPSLV